MIFKTRQLNPLRKEPRVNDILPAYSIVRRQGDLTPLDAILDLKRLNGSRSKTIYRSSKRPKQLRVASPDHRHDSHRVM